MSTKDDRVNVPGATDDAALMPTWLFAEFQKRTVKIQNFAIKDMFVRQLLQLKQLSLDKALAIVQRYPTPASLLSAYAAANDDGDDGELLLANIQYGQLRKTIGPVISKCIYHFYHAQSVS